MKEYFEYIITPYSDKDINAWNAEMEISEGVKDIYNSSIEEILNEGRKIFDANKSKKGLIAAIKEVYLTVNFKYKDKNYAIYNLPKELDNYAIVNERICFNRLITALSLNYTYSMEKARDEYDLREPEYYLREMYEMLYPGQEPPEYIFRDSNECCVIM